MATVNFLYRSTKQKAPLTLRLLYRHKNKDYVFSTKIKYEVEQEYWKKHYKNTKDAEIKNKQIEVNTELQKIENFVLDAFKETNVNDISKYWLNEQVHIYYNPPTENKLSEYVTDVVQQIIDEAHIRGNAKGGIGLGECRINAYKRLKQLIIEFQGKKKLKIKDLNNNKFDEIKNWLLKDKKYSSTYSAKKLSDFNGVCKYARSKGVEVSIELDSIKTKQVSAYDDDMDVITLTEDEIEKIENADLNSEALVNARKWLILACFTGQRGKSLTTRIKKENFHIYGKDLIIKIIQKKGNKPIIIPVLPKVRKIYEEGLPYEVSIQKLNKHFKEIGRIAKLDEMVMGRIQEKGRRGVKKLRPKHTYISTHIGRRTFASIHYGKMPTPIIMRVTGHSKESTFLGYINQTDDSHIATFLDYYKTKELKAQKKSQLTIVKEAQ
ncbi:phage integrase SAM-like domain-containing protein [Confluentibacter sediminis]|uniref:phage integrase SAM-like domain-containing protein n=1 Tax=Confluentibacter sediminis TaxID=2219045 RepID=UPI000DAC7307|nr:phage integrase SAM-like domain-containing protein [Confluentibacter sediminis]